MTWLALTLLSVAIICFVYVHPRYRSRPLPPGPKGLPILGNLLQMPSLHPWKVFAKWSDTWGDIMYLDVLQQPILVVSSAKIAIDLLEKRGAIYSDRPHYTLAGEMAGYNQVLTLLPYGPDSRLQRKILHKYLGTRQDIDKFVPLLELENHRLLRRVLDEPHDLVEFLRLAMGSVILKMIYGFEALETNDPLIKMNEDVNHDFAEMVGGIYLVDFLPILKHIPAWFPGAGFKRRAIASRQTCNDMVDVPYDFVQREMEVGRALPSLASSLIAEEELTAQREYVIKWVTAIVYGAGADDTFSALQTFFLAMCLYPEAQKQAQAEIDRVIGPLGRLPTLSDREDLVYVDALVKEVYRWNQVTPLGIPHRLSRDDVYQNYFIPKNTSVIVNVWKILHDPKTYKNPMSFNPSRFNASPGKIPEPDPRAYYFGFGRRRCAGLNFADAAVFMTCAMSLAVFSISKDTITNPDGSVTEIEPQVDYSSGIISHPKPFPYSIRPRSSDAEATIRSLKI